MKLKNVLLISVFSIGIILVIASGVRGSESEWRPLGEQEKKAILDEIADQLAKLKSIGISYDWKDGPIDKNGKENIEGEYSLFSVFDDHRNYQLKSRPGGISKKVDADSNSDFAHLDEYSWNGSRMKTLDHRSRTGSVRNKAGPTRPEESTVFSIIGRNNEGGSCNNEGGSWLMRYQNRDALGKEYDVEVNANNQYRVTERPKTDAPVSSRYIVIFDQKKGMAITRWSKENVFPDRVFRFSDTFLDDFRQVNGFYIPFKISRKVELDAEPSFSSVQYVTVKDVTINDRSHDKFLRDFTFPNGSRIYDYILKMPVNISSKEVNSSPVTKDRQNRAYKLGLVLLGLFIVLAVIAVGMVMKKRSTGCGMFIIICCSVLLGSDVFANDTGKFQSYGPELLDGLTPEHRAIHERDLGRL